MKRIICVHLAVVLALTSARIAKSWNEEGGAYNQYFSHIISFTDMHFAEKEERIELIQLSERQADHREFSRGYMFSRLFEKLSTRQITYSRYCTSSWKNRIRSRYRQLCEVCDMRYEFVILIRVRSIHSSLLSPDEHCLKFTTFHGTK